MRGQGRSPARALRAAVLAAVLTALCAGAAPARAMTGPEIVQVINAERRANKLPAVREDPALSAGCAQFDEYRRMNGSLEDAFTLHGEQPGRPGYTSAGARAAHDSLVNAGDRVADSFAAGDVFDDAPGHIVALMDPGVAVIGADQTDFPLGIFGTVHLVCVDVRSAPQRAKPRHLRLYLYRGPFGRLPGRHLAYREGPSGLGSLLAVYFEAPARAKVRLRSLTIRNAAGKTRGLISASTSGGLIYAPRRARMANNTTESPTPKEQGRVPGTIEEDPQLRALREKHEQEVEDRRWREQEPIFEDPEIRQYREAQERETAELQEKLMVKVEAEQLDPSGGLPVHVWGPETL
jgi:hypothetical protein